MAEETINDIIRDEGGIVLKPYFCNAKNPDGSRGKLSQGIGRNVEDRPFTRVEINDLRTLGFEKGYVKLFQQDLIRNENQLKRIRTMRLRIGGKFKNKKWTPVDYERLDKEVKVIVANMAYNMGTTSLNPSEWPNFFYHLSLGNHKLAAFHGRDSKWRKKDVPLRAERLMLRLEQIEVPKHYGIIIDI